jgi:RNA polymerase sigma-70 factor (ECF subfamily)
MRTMTVPVSEQRDEAYWDDLYARAHAVLYRTAALLVSPAEAEEVVQEAFERALHVADFGESTREPVAWLRTVVGRIALDRLRRGRLWERARALLAATPVPDPDVPLRDALQRLPARQRVALVLRYYQDAPYEEIAEALSIQAESVGPLLSRAKQSLREALQ